VRGKRRLKAAVTLTDMVGFSSLPQRDEQLIQRADGTKTRE
jgi:hypothetical protein